MNDFSDIDTMPLPPQRHKNGCGFTWSKEDDERLATLWPQHSAGIIAKMMFPPRSRNAIIGRAHRIGLGMKIKKSDKPKRVARRKHTGPPRLTAAKSKPRVEIAINPQGWTPIGVTLLEAEAHHCRAIIEPATAAAPANTIFCGHPIADKTLSYCEYHLELYTEARRGMRRHWRHWSHARR